ncbi:hypothetical protein [uncultured Acetatifactor sp.]|uniref:hypothetical protein n=1 Tax=uncultured Acetatifactor sp. TaxID=1671927 RepID=UPI00261D890D|nr:hypothetical protein [uncultured Acetatifactor sp.]
MKMGYMYSGRGAARFEDIAIPAHTYVACGTERCKYPATIDVRLCRRSVEEWLPSSGYVLAEAPGISVPHWFRNPDRFSLCFRGRGIIMGAAADRVGRGGHRA